MFCAVTLCFAVLLCALHWFYVLQCADVQCADVQKCSDASGQELSMHGEQSPGCIIPQSLLTTTSSIHYYPQFLTEHATPFPSFRFCSYIFDELERNWREENSAQPAHCIWSGVSLMKYWNINQICLSGLSVLRIPSLFYSNVATSAIHHQISLLSVYCAPFPLENINHNQLNINLSIMQLLFMHFCIILQVDYCANLVRILSIFNSECF